MPARAQYGVHVAKFCVDSNYLNTNTSASPSAGAAAIGRNATSISTPSAATAAITRPGGLAGSMVSPSLANARQYLGDTRSTFAASQTVSSSLVPQTNNNNGIVTLTDRRRQIHVRVLIQIQVHEYQ